MKSNLINKSKKLTYKKPTIKKLQISRLSIENNTKIKKIQKKGKQNIIYLLIIILHQKILLQKQIIQKI